MIFQVRLSPTKTGDQLNVYFILFYFFLFFHQRHLVGILLIPWRRHARCCYVAIMLVCIIRPG